MFCSRFDPSQYSLVKILIHKIETQGVESTAKSLSISEEELKRFDEKLLITDLPRTPQKSNALSSIEDHISFKAGSPHLQEFDGVEDLDLLVFKIKALATKMEANGKTILNIALERQDLPMIKLLICIYPALLHIKYETQSILHDAVVNGCSNEIVDWLTYKACLLNGDAEAIDLNVTDVLGNTPLHYALESGNRELALHLISKGANKYFKNKLNQTPSESLTQFIYRNSYHGAPLALLMNLIQLAQEFSSARDQVS
ncbi:ankyrin repeat domain-containing protein [Criblamydia sequanensis]|uniref:Ankyrin repeat-containing protein n=1 Tax=Candidatus Criblamydia sequanensis CRIB-18 TaxID=1437425 RepID=A0A090D087_9BACT|nr:ankyrin repeat domain-containing protein [Criblamydia sequanensis]CDR34912.1 Ankyrin repeat-containing protein [Criblamydia sequanensis CRIB-18]